MKTYLICDDCEIKKPFIDYPAAFDIVFSAFEIEHAGHHVRAVNESETKVAKEGNNE